MAVTTFPVGAPTSYSWTKDTSGTNAFTNSTNVRNGSCILYAILGYVATGTTNDTFLKVYDNNGADLTAGTTEPDWIARWDTKVAGIFGFFCHEGVLLSNGLSYLLADAAGKDSTTAPDQTVVLWIATN